MEKWDVTVIGGGCFIGKTGISDLGSGTEFEMGRTCGDPMRRTAAYLILARTRAGACLRQFQISRGGVRYYGICTEDGKRWWTPSPL